MNEKDFLENYLWPSDDRLNRNFTHPLLKIEGLKKCGDFILQSELEETFATSIMTKYESNTLGVRLLEVYRCTQHKGTGFFARIVGTMNLVKIGYPTLNLDAPIRNVSRTGEREDLTTRVRISLPQADPEQSKILFSRLSEQAKGAGIYGEETQLYQLPDFWGPMWMAESKGVNLDMIRELRDYAWSSYKSVIEQTKEKTPFDYKPLQEYLIFDAARSEQLMFKRMGLSFPVEVQAAFFSVMVSGL